jgi:hypothetical protein
MAQWKYIHTHLECCRQSNHSMLLALEVEAEMSSISTCVVDAHGSPGVYWLHSG